MAYMLKPLKLAFHRTGIFDGFTVYGFLYLTEGTLERAWHITTYCQGGEISDYWVVGQDFHAVSIHYAYQMTNETRIEVHGIIQDVPDCERKVALESIRQWSEAYRDEILAF